MVMFKARFRPLGASTLLQAQQQQQQQPQSRMRAGQQPQQPPKPTVPPIEDERGPQAPVREPEPQHEPERAEA